MPTTPLTSASTAEEHASLMPQDEKGHTAAYYEKRAKFWTWAAKALLIGCLTVDMIAALLMWGGWNQWSESAKECHDPLPPTPQPDLKPTSCEEYPNSARWMFFGGLYAGMAATFTLFTAPISAYQKAKEAREAKEELEQKPQHHQSSYGAA